MREGGVERWRLLGRLLPREIRERIFEPAFGDLMYTWLKSTEGTRRLPFGAHAMGTYVGCFSIALPRLFMRSGRLTRLGRFSLWAVGCLTTLVLVVANWAQSYASYSP